MKKTVLILTCCILLSGCGLGYSGLNLLTPGNAPVRVSEEEKLAFDKARRLIGQSKQDILNEFGPRMKISGKKMLVLNETMPGYGRLHPLLEKNLSYISGMNSYYNVDEAGFYKYDAGMPVVMPDEYAVFFYFIDDICVYVSGS